MLLLSLDAAQIHVSSYLRSDPCHQLQRIERLRHIVICAYIETGDFIVVLRFCRKHYDGYVLFLPDFHCGLHPVHSRHHHIHYDKVKLLLSCNLKGLYPVIGLEHIVALISQIDFNGSCNFSVVVAYQNIDVRHFRSFHLHLSKSQ